MFARRLRLTLGIVALVLALLASAALPAAAQIQCNPTGTSCPAEYDGCASCGAGSWKVRYKNYQRYNCADGSYLCRFTHYTYGPCGWCFE